MSSHLPFGGGRLSLWNELKVACVAQGSSLGAVPRLKGCREISLLAALAFVSQV